MVVFESGVVYRMKMRLCDGFLKKKITDALLCDVMIPEKSDTLLVGMDNIVVWWVVG